MEGEYLEIVEKVRPIVERVRSIMQADFSGQEVRLTEAEEMEKMMRFEEFCYGRSLPEKYVFNVTQGDLRLRVELSKEKGARYRFSGKPYGNYRAIEELNRIVEIGKGLIRDK